MAMIVRGSHGRYIYFCKLIAALFDRAFWTWTPLDVRYSLLLPPHGVHLQQLVQTARGRDRRSGGAVCMPGSLGRQARN